MATGDTQITITGNLIEDPELRFTPQGQPVAKFRVASVPRYFDKGTNEWQDGDGLFLTVNVWRQQAENVCERPVRGSRVGGHRAAPAALVRDQGGREAHRVRDRGG